MQHSTVNLNTGHLVLRTIWLSNGHHDLNNTLNIPDFNPKGIQNTDYLEVFCPVFKQCPLFSTILKSWLFVQFSDHCLISWLINFQITWILDLSGNQTFTLLWGLEYYMDCRKTRHPNTVIIRLTDKLDFRMAVLCSKAKCSINWLAFENRS
jgi:hypothetical protein